MYFYWSIILNAGLYASSSIVVLILVLRGSERFIHRRSRAEELLSLIHMNVWIHTAESPPQGTMLDVCEGLMPEDARDQTYGSASGFICVMQMHISQVVLCRRGRGWVASGSGLRCKQIQTDKTSKEQFTQSRRLIWTEVKLLPNALQDKYINTKGALRMNSSSFSLCCFPTVLDYLAWLIRPS